MKNYVPEGAFLYCDKGVIPTPFRITEHAEVHLTSVKLASDVNNKGIVNVIPFGICAVKGGQPCLPATNNNSWKNPVPYMLAGTGAPLLDDSSLPCTQGGIIRIAPSFFHALAEMYSDPSEIFDRMLDMLKGTGENVLAFGKGAAKGLWGLVKFVWDVAKFPFVEGWTALTDWDQFTDNWSSRYNSAKEFGQAALETGEQLYGLARDPDARAAMWAYMSNPDVWEEAFEGVYKAVSTMDNTEIAEFGGQMAFEVLLDVFTGGMGASRHIRHTDDVFRAAQAFENMGDFRAAGRILDNVLPDELIGRIDDIDDVPGGQTILGQADNIPDLENVYHVKSTEYAQSVLDNIDPQYFNRDNRFADGFYVALEGKTAITEVVHHGGNMNESNVIRFAMDKDKLNVLDLTDPDIADTWNYADALAFEQKVELGQIADANKYQESINLADEARSQGYNAIIFNSRRAEGGTNIVIFETAEHSVNDILSPEMIMPATD